MSEPLRIHPEITLLPTISIADYRHDQAAVDRALFPEGKARAPARPAGRSPRPPGRNGHPRPSG